MGEKVISINGRNSIDQTNGNQVSAEFVDMMERFLVKVKAGEVTSIYACGFTQDGGQFQIGWFGNDSLFESIGIIEAMKLRYAAPAAGEGEEYPE